MNSKSVCRTVYLTKSTDNELNQYIDGEIFRNRSHAIESIVKEWLRLKRETVRGIQKNIFDGRKGR